MTYNSIEVAAESIEEAREKAKLLTPPERCWFSENIVSDGKPKSIQFVGETIEDAFTKAQNEIPEDAVILDKKVIKTPKIESTLIEDVDESGVRKRITNKYGDLISIKALDLLKRGAHGLFGIGARPNQYEATILFPATVEIRYKTKVRLVVELEDIETRVAELIKDLNFHSPDDVPTLEASIEFRERVHLLQGSELREAKWKLWQAQKREIEVRSQALSKLGEISHPLATEALSAALQDKYSVIQSGAARALGRLGDKRAIKILMENLKLNKSREWEDDKAVADLVDATQTLLNLSAKTLDLEDLEMLAQLENLQNIKTERVYELNSEADDPYINTEWHEEGRVVSTLDLSPIRELARQELARRKEKS